MLFIVDLKAVLILIIPSYATHSRVLSSWASTDADLVACPVKYSDPHSYRV